jgi:L-threonylcarbamoyladenylate synthase
MLSVQAAAQLIAQGELVAFPTETVYGLGADASRDQAVVKIFAAKGRPADHPLIVHVSNSEAAEHFAAEIPDFARQLMAAFWPGPLTVILPRKVAIAAASAGGQDSIGLRCPSHPIARELLQECERLGMKGIAAPSANKFGKVSPTTAAHVREEFGGSIPVLDGGACEVGIESTIIDCTRGSPVLLRPGTLMPAQLQLVLGNQLLLNREQTLITPLGLTGNNALKMPAAPRASGSLASHYAPLATLRLMNAKALQTALDLLGPEAKNIAIYARTALKSPSAHLILRRMPDDALAVAQQLFAVLREFDAKGVKLIWVEEVPIDPAWDGVRDRLQRAAS